jgi:hypothetical protein
MYIIFFLTIIGDDEKKAPSPDSLIHAQVKIMIWISYFYSWIHIFAVCLDIKPATKLNLIIITFVLATLNTVIFSTMKFDNYLQYRHGPTLLLISIMYILYLGFALVHLLVTYLISKFCKPQYSELEQHAEDNIA